MRVERRATTAGAAVLVAGLVAMAALNGLGMGGAAWRAWLAGAALAVSLPAGAIGWVLAMRLCVGEWTGPVSEACAAMAGRMPLAALLFAPVLIGLPQLYPWMHKPPDAAFTAAYLSPIFFDVRTVLWLAALSFAGWFIGSGRSVPKAAAAIGVIAFFLLQTMAVTDWLASLQAHFNSSGFGLYLICIQFACALALAILAGRPEETHRAGALLITLIMMWGYFAFMQYFILWSGNLPAGIAWYKERQSGIWPWLMLLVALCRLPVFACLLFRAVRHSRRWMQALAGVVLFGSMVEMAWIALPGAGASAVDGLLYAALACGAVALAWPPRATIPDEGGAA